MVTHQINLVLFLVPVLAIAVVTDLRSHRIPNWLVLPAMLAAVALHTASRGLPGLAFSVAGILCGMALLMPFYLLGGMGAGDVKLIGAVGGFLGPEGVFYAFLFTALVGGIYALFLLAVHGRLMETVGRYAFLAKSLMLTGKIAYVPPGHDEKAPVLCYGLAIAIGTLLAASKGWWL